MFELFGIPGWIYAVALVAIVLAVTFYDEFTGKVTAFGTSAARRLPDLSRGWPLLLVFVLTFAAVVLLNPAKAGLALWGVSKIALCAYVGYWADRLCFRPEDRPHLLVGIAQGTAWKRRALIVAAAILAGGMLP